MRRAISHSQIILPPTGKAEDALPAMSAGSFHALRQTGTGSLNGVGYTPYPSVSPP